jgi:hypothetical protein
MLGWLPSKMEARIGGGWVVLPTFGFLVEMATRWALALSRFPATMPASNSRMELRFTGAGAGWVTTETDVIEVHRQRR